MELVYRNGNTTVLVVPGDGTKTLNLPDDTALRGERIKGIQLLPAGGFYPGAGTSETTTASISMLELADSKGNLIAAIPGKALIADTGNTLSEQMTFALQNNVDLKNSRIYTTSGAPGADVAFVFIFITE